MKDFLKDIPWYGQTALVFIIAWFAGLCAAYLIGG